MVLGYAPEPFSVRFSAPFCFVFCPAPLPRVWLLTFCGRFFCIRAFRSGYEICTVSGTGFVPVRVQGPYRICTGWGTFSVRFDSCRYDTVPVWVRISYRFGYLVSEGDILSAGYEKSTQTGFRLGVSLPSASWLYRKRFRLGTGSGLGTDHFPDCFRYGICTGLGTFSGQGWLGTRLGTGVWGICGQPEEVGGGEVACFRSNFRAWPDVRPKHRLPVAVFCLF